MHVGKTLPMQLKNLFLHARCITVGITTSTIVQNNCDFITLSKFNSSAKEHQRKMCVLKLFWYAWSSDCALIGWAIFAYVDGTKPNQRDLNICRAG